MTTRCKVFLANVIGLAYGNGVKALFNCQYDPSIPEDQRFQKATPSGSCEFIIDNPEAIKQLKIGGYYYLDLTAVPPPAG